MTPVRRSLTGWLAPRWPNLSLKVLEAERLRQELVPEADAEDGHLAEQALDGLDGVGDGGRVAGAVAQEHAVRAPA